MIVTEITPQDYWYKELYRICFEKLDVWFENLNNPRYKAYHIEQKAFLIIQIVDSNEFEIITIGVHPKFRRNGLAKNLLNNLFQNLQKGSKFFLEVRSDNLGAIAFYQSLGFKILSVRKQYYQGVDALSMSLVF